MAVELPRARILAAARDFAGRVRAAFPDRVDAVTLFGSQARGGARPDSDVDVLVVVRGLTNAEGRELAGLAGDVLTDHGVLVSAFTQSTEHWQLLRGRERLIVREIDREGVPL